MKRLIVVVVLGVCYTLISAAPAWADHTINGVFLTDTDGVGDSKTNCYGTGSYDDVSHGLQVVVRNESHKILATSKLGKGHSGLAGFVCTFKFTIEDVPDAKFYSIEVGHRGDITYSAKELEKKKWKVAFSLG
jgi:hypothetical protein